MDQSSRLQQGILIQLRNVATKQYLKGTIHFVTMKSFFRQKELEEYYLGTTQKEDDFYTYFIIQKYLPTNNNLELGDIVSIQNYGQVQYVNLNSKRQSEVTKQCYAYLGEEKHYFVIQSDNDIFTNNCQTIETSITNKYLRFTSIDNGYSLHSHPKAYKAQHVSQYNEVSGYKNCDENTLWEILPVKQNQIKGFIHKVQTYQLIQIYCGDIIIIRNLKTGWTLHSHTTCYKSTKLQEVSLFSYPRDNNDFWIITKSNLKDIDDGILKKNDEIILQHYQTNRFLQCSNFQSYSQSGLQVYGSDSKPMTGFLFEQFDNFPLRVNHPFVIKNSTNNLYLSCSNFQTESKIGTQQEAVFVQKINDQCLWVVEFRKQ
ncbi:unnamed protein product [Paramecium pentaurelia]|uniref:MIR domain-containing protein n=1 Tax=Paramecium pentaurelia TaxID=43138 RepID=A0A8S1S071_9CILI|nr:unnamed protein product [Paramecium pentaurelia]